jgi:hypothetical protein
MHTIKVSTTIAIDHVVEHTFVYIYMHTYMHAYYPGFYNCCLQLEIDNVVEENQDIIESFVMSLGA